MLYLTATTPHLAQRDSRIGGSSFAAMQMTIFIS